MTQASSPGLLSSDPLISLLDRATQQLRESGELFPCWAARPWRRLADLVALAETLAQEEPHHGLG
jgi:hypothetical protein